MDHANTRRTANFLFASLVAGFAMLFMIASPAQAQKLKKLSNDTFKNSSSQHATEVEPDTYSFGSSFVSAFQVGRRYANGGASDIGFVTTNDGGSTWKSGFLPGM